MSVLSKKIVAVIIAVGAVACSAFACAQNPLRAAGQDVPPWVVHNEGTNALSGISIDLMNAVARDLGVQVQYQIIPMADLIPAMSSGKIDIIATNMAITAERRQQVDFTHPIYNAPTEAVVVPVTDTTAYRNLDDLKSLPIGVMKGSIQLALLQRTGGFSNINIYDTEWDCWKAVASGVVKAAMTSGSTTAFAVKQGRLAGMRVVSSYQSPSTRAQPALAVKKGNSELLAKLDQSLRRLEADGTVKAIFNKYGLDDWEAIQ